MKNKKESLLLGAHMSIAGGLEKAIIRGELIGCTAIQLFTKSNRQWQAEELTEPSVSLFKKTANESLVTSIIAHASYLINLAAEEPLIYKKSIDALLQEVMRCEQLDIPYLVVHPGSAGKQERSVALHKIALALEIILNQTMGKTMILLETVAGQGTSLGNTFEELAEIRNGVKTKELIGICVDTCHIFAAGYDISSVKGYQETWKKFDSLIGLSHLKAFHLNDSMKNLASRVDRHAHIGEGKIGLEAFALLLNDPRFFDIPKILETPKGEDEMHDDIKNMEILRKLCHNP